MQPIQKARIRNLRTNSTYPEKCLWILLRSRRLNRYKFRRQFPIGPYIVDFVCVNKRLVIELDGEQHVDSAEYDNRRTAFLRSKNYKVIRFWNDEVVRDMDGVLKGILDALECGVFPHPDPLPHPPS